MEPKASAFHLVIIGNGIAGITAARHVRMLNPAARITVVSDETDHFYSRTALMYVYMGHLTFEHTKPYEDHFWAKNRIALVRDYVERIDFGAQTLHLRSRTTLDYDRLLLAVGSTYKRLGIPGEDLRGVQGLYGLPDLEQMEADTQGVRHAVITGGGLIGVEMAEMLHTRGIEVTFLVKDGWYMARVLPREEGQMIVRHLQAHGIDVRLHTEIARFEGDAHGRVREVLTRDGEPIRAEFVGTTIGVEPNVAFLRGTALDIDRGILVDPFLRTNLPNVYAAGDCAQHREPPPGRKSVEQIWYTGRLQGATVAHTLCGTPSRYEPGLFFNSAKFFDIEYQTYGQIDPELPPGHQTHYWEHPDGERSLRIQTAPAPDRGDRVVGFNVMGVRFRQEVCERWIQEGRSFAYVQKHLRQANFDPEFYPHFEHLLV